MKIYIADNKIISADDEPNFDTYEVIEVDDDSKDMSDNGRGTYYYREDELTIDHESVGYWYNDQDGGEGEYYELFNVSYLSM